MDDIRLAREIVRIAFLLTSAESVPLAIKDIEKAEKSLKRVKPDDRKTKKVVDDVEDALSSAGRNLKKHMDRENRLRDQTHVM